MNLNIFKKGKKIFKKRDYRPDPDFYWKIIFFLGLILIITSLVFGMYLFLQINKEDFSSSVTDGGQINKVSKERIDKVLQYFSDREEKSLDIVNFPSPIIDPSL